MNNLKAIFQYIKSKNESTASLMLLLLLSADLIFILLHIIHFRHVSILRSPFFDIGKDLGYAEVYQYIKYFWIVILLTYILINTKCINYLSWIVVFTYFLCDDSMQIHERIGWFVAGNLRFIPPLNLRLQDFGELIVTTIVGIFLFALLTLAYLRGSYTFKKISKDLFLFIIALVFFGVFLDIADNGIKLGWFVEQSLDIIEDGGEMIVVSLIFWYVFLLATHNGNSDLSLYDHLYKIKRKGST